MMSMTVKLKKKSAQNFMSVRLPSGVTVPALVRIHNSGSTPLAVRPKTSWKVGPVSAEWIDDKYAVIFPGNYKELPCRLTFDLAPGNHHIEAVLEGATVESTTGVTPVPPITFTVNADIREGDLKTSKPSYRIASIILP